MTTISKTAKVELGGWTGNYVPPWPIIRCTLIRKLDALPEGEGMGRVNDDPRNRAGGLRGRGWRWFVRHPFEPLCGGTWLGSWLVEGLILVVVACALVYGIKGLARWWR